MSSIAEQIKLLANLSRWMTAERVAVDELSPELIERYVTWRRASG